MEYHEQMKHPLWQKKRLEVLEANSFQCEECESKDVELHVHHPYYKRGAMIWDYAVEELKCLCNKCHKDTHSIDEIIKQELSFLSIYEKMRVLGYIDGFNGPVRIGAKANNDYCLGYIDHQRTETEYLIDILHKHWAN